MRDIVDDERRFRSPCNLHQPFGLIAMWNESHARALPTFLEDEQNDQQDEQERFVCHSMPSNGTRP
jgi:hypothetical protein